MNRYMTENEAKRAIVEYGKRIYDRGYVAANDGNITVRVSENEIWATPTTVSKGYMNIDMLIKLDLEGNVLTQSEYRPSSEIKMHLRVYAENPAVGCVIHAHPVAATAMAIIGEPIVPDTLAEPLTMLGEIPVAEFALPGTDEVPNSVAPYCKSHDCLLLANHGALAWGRNIHETYFKFESLEHFCQIHVITQLLSDGGKKIPPEKVNSIMAVRGLLKKGVPLSDITPEKMAEQSG